MSADIEHHLPASTAVFFERLVSPDWLVVVDAIAAKT